MAKTKTPNQIKPTKRVVWLTGKAVATSRAAGTITVTRRSVRLTANEAPASHRSRRSIRGPDPSTAVENRARIRPDEDNNSKHRVITLTQGKFAIVDADDYERLAAHKWYAAKIGGQFYAHRRANGIMIRMHREIVNPPPGMLCDHKNHNTLDNRKSNLRICTAAQNAHNQLPRTGGTSRYKGVCWDKHTQKWRAQIGHEGKRILIGYYDYEADAAIAYDDMAIDLFGEFACLNFDHRPEIKLWMEATYLFTTTRNELAGTEVG